MPLSVAIVEDDDRVRESLAILLDGAPGFRLAGKFPSAEAALRNLPKLEVDVVLMDVHLPGMSGVKCVAGLKAALPRVQIVMLTVEDDDGPIFEALEAGASGYLLKGTSPAELLEAIATLPQGGVPMSSSIARRVLQHFRERGEVRRQADHLTKREKDVLKLLSQGYIYEDIAKELSLSYSTVHTHVQRIYAKLQVKSRGEAALKFLAVTGRNPNRNE